LGMVCVSFLLLVKSVGILREQFPGGYTT